MSIEALKTVKAAEPVRITPRRWYYRGQLIREGVPLEKLQEAERLGVISQYLEGVNSAGKEHNKPTIIIDDEKHPQPGILYYKGVAIKPGMTLLEVIKAERDGKLKECQVLDVE